MGFMTKDEMLVRLYIRGFRKSPREVKVTLLKLLLDMEQERHTGLNDDDLDYMLFTKLNGFAFMYSYFPNKENIKKLADFIRTIPGWGNKALKGGDYA